MNRAERRSNDFDVKAYIKASNEIEGIYSEEEDAQSLLAWAYLDSCELLHHADIMRVQKMITLHQPLAPNARGYYRGMAGNNVNVTVGGRLAPDHSYVPDLMNGWLLDTPEMTPLVSHIRFESIHPFVDGNGRTGRMLYWYICKRRGIKPYRYNADNEKNHQAYYRLFDPKRIIKLSNLKWRLRDEDMVQKEADKPVKFAATFAMKKAIISPLFDTEAQVYTWLEKNHGEEAVVDGKTTISIDFDDFDIFGLDAIDLQLMDENNQPPELKGQQL